MDKTQPDAIQQRPRSGATRCPYCHDECEAGHHACACADCLSRHHSTCWDEGGGCSSCRSTNRLTAGPPREGSGKRDQRAGEAWDKAVSLVAQEEEDPNPRYGEVIDAWLKLGLAYNIGLAGLTLLLLNTMLLDFKVGVQVFVGAILANLCFTSGPGIELLARRFGFRNTRPLRWVLFFVGFCVAGVLALANCLSLIFPGA